MSTQIQFYFDPSCPWCWVTSRWLSEVSNSRDLDIDWCPFSLAAKNDELHGNDTTGHMKEHMKAHSILRVIEAVHEKEGTSRGELYTAFGRAYYLDNTISDESLISSVLQELSLDSSFADAADDVNYDAQLQSHLDEAIEIVGNDVGVPLIVFVNESGEKQGYFGPVLQGMPSPEEGLKLWDGLSQLATSSHFFELKRGRTGGAEPASTSRVF